MRAASLSEKEFGDALNAGPNVLTAGPFQQIPATHFCRVPGQIKRREVELDLQVGPEEIMSREVELGCESWTSFASGCSSTAVQRTLSL